MAKRRKEKPVPEFKAPTAPVSPIYSNVVGIFTGEETLVVDFGLFAPSYIRPYEVEDNQVSRILMTWSTAEIFLGLLKKAISDHKKELKSKKAQIK